MPLLLAVCAVHQLRPNGRSQAVTAIDKRALSGRAKIGPFGVNADVQANRKHHGGLDKAVYAYSAEDAAYWQEQLGRELPPGWFGENLRVEGFDVNASRIGDVWHVGDDVTLQVTMPRTPCQTFSRWVGGSEERGWVRRFSTEMRLGPYLKVIRSGFVQAGDPIEVVAAGDGAPGLLDDYVHPFRERV